MKKNLEQTKKAETIAIKDGEESTEYGFTFDTIEEPMGIVGNEEDTDN